MQDGTGARGPLGSLARGLHRHVVTGLCICASLGGCASAAVSSTQPARAPTSPTPCPTKALTAVPPTRWMPARRRLAPAGAMALRLCRYSGLNARPRLTLVSSRLLTSHSIVRQLVEDFDRLPAPPSGAVACPADDSSQIVTLLAYPAGHRVTITVGLTGCREVTNGSVARTAFGFGSPRAYGPQLVRELERLLRTRSGTRTALARARWSVLARSPLRVRYGPVLLWDGRELLEIGGTLGGRLGGPPSQDAAAYDPTARHWRRLAAMPAAVLGADAAAVWTGRRAFVFGEPSLPGERASELAGLYDPASNRWTVTGRAPLRPLNSPSAVWTGDRVIVAGMTRGEPALEVAAYDPGSGRWSRLQPPISRRHPPLAIALVATGKQVLLWSMWGRTRQSARNTHTSSYGVDVFRLGRSGGWRNVTGSWPQGQTVDQPLFTGRQILLAPGQIWCGACSHPPPVGAHGYLVDPRTLRLSAIPHGPLDDLGPQIIWTGTAELSLNQTGEISGPHEQVLPGDIAIWSPRTGRWTRGPRAPAQVGVAPAVWSDQQLLVLARDGRLLSYGR